MGLIGKMTATVAGPELRVKLNTIVAELGAYPHEALTLGGGKKQTTRLLKVQCECCGYTARITQKWADVGALTCPFGNELELVA